MLMVDEPGGLERDRPALGSFAGKALNLVNLPMTVWARLAVLFLALVSIKVILLVGLRKHLFEIHWRLAGREIIWSDYAAFYGFLILGVLSLAELGRRCQAVGLKAVRASNAAVLALGLLFIF